MITKDELKEYASLMGLNLGQAEKDYFQNIILFVLYQNHGKDIVFKGGTALKKAYGLDRFSEDLDFTCLNKVDAKNLVSGLKGFRLEFEHEDKEYPNGLKIILRIKGPLYVGIRPSLCRFIVDFSFRENVILKPVIKTIGRFLEEIPAFDVVVMQEKEILAEKVRAIMTRIQPRDVYDAWFLLNKGIAFDLGLTREKLRYYNETWDYEHFKERLGMKEEFWEKGLSPLIPRVPDFNMVRKEILAGIKKAGGDKA